jgi:hypothetical protein
MFSHKSKSPPNQAAGFLGQMVDWLGEQITEKYPKYNPQANLVNRQGTLSFPKVGKVVMLALWHQK